jgi:hypothetical protein
VAWSSKVLTDLARAELVNRFAGGDVRSEVGGVRFDVTCTSSEA